MRLLRVELPVARRPCRLAGEDAAEEQRGYGRRGHWSLSRELLQGRSRCTFLALLS